MGVHMNNLFEGEGKLWIDIAWQKNIGLLEQYKQLIKVKTLKALTPAWGQC